MARFTFFSKNNLKRISCLQDDGLGALMKSLEKEKELEMLDLSANKLGAKTGLAVRYEHIYFNVMSKDYKISLNLNI